MSKDRFRYEIDENNAVRIWDSNYPTENNEPNSFQPHPPTEPYRLFESKEEAEAWALQAIDEALNPPVILKPVAPETVEETDLEVE